MNFVLDPTLFSGQAAPAPPELVALALAASEGRHRIQVDDAAREGFERWAASLGALRDAVTDAEKTSARDSARMPSEIQVTVEVRDASSWPSLRLTAADAAGLAQKPFRVFLENGASDRQFMLALFRPEDRRWIEERQEREWLELEGCGGVGEVGKRSEWALKHASRAIRCAALFDGDAVEPAAGEPESEEAFAARLMGASRRTREICRREPLGPMNGLLHHTLRRRTIENYLPPSAFERWSRDAREGRARRRREAKVRELERCGHRAHYNVKGGYAGDRRREPLPSWLPTARDTPLEQGFGEEIWRRFEGVCRADLDPQARQELSPFVERLLERIR